MKSTSAITASESLTAIINHHQSSHESGIKKKYSLSALVRNLVQLIRTSKKIHQVLLRKQNLVLFTQMSTLCENKNSQIVNRELW